MGGPQRVHGRRRLLRRQAASGFRLDSTGPCPGVGRATYLAAPASLAASDSAGRLALASRTRSCSDRYSWWPVSLVFTLRSNVSWVRHGAVELQMAGSPTLGWHILRLPGGGEPVCGHRGAVAAAVHRRWVREPVAAAQRAQVVVERVVLHHQQYDVADLRDPVRTRRQRWIRQHFLVPGGVTVPQTTPARHPVQPLPQSGLRNIHHSYIVTLTRQSPYPGLPTTS